MKHQETKLWRQILKIWPEAMEYQYTPVFTAGETRETRHETGH